MSPPFPSSHVIRHPEWLAVLRGASAKRRGRDSRFEDEGKDLAVADIVAGAASTTLLLVDDVGADESPTNFTRSVTVQLLDRRERTPGSITIITSNLPIGDPRWDTHVDERGVSRMLGMAKGRVFDVGGPDRRLQ